MNDSDALRSFDRQDTLRLLKERRNWNRWGSDDELGALNLITPEKRLQAAGLVRSGDVVPLGRPLMKDTNLPNSRPALHFMDAEPQGGGGGWSNDFVALPIHGISFTHLDALCHNWDDDGMFNGRSPEDVLAFKGASYGSIDKWAQGIVTRGVLIDVPRHRGTPHVTQDDPVHGWEIEEICAANNIDVGPGDAVAVYSGREAWSREHGLQWGSVKTDEGKPLRPGLHASCLEFLRDHDSSVLVWDMMDMLPNQVDLPWSVHGAIFAFGLALVDNALLEPLAAVCAERGSYEFMFAVNPLNVPGATGSPVNPMAIL